MKKPSVRSIAAELGISAVTAARALAGGVPVAEETRRRVLETAHRVGYKRPGEHKRLLLVVSDAFCKGAYDRSMVTELVARCASMRLGLMLITESNLDELKNIPFDGLFSLSYDNRVNRQLAELFHCPLVCFNNYQCHRENIYSVNSDEAGAISAAVAHFNAAGHRRIGLLAVASRDFSHQWRKKLFLTAIEERPEMTGFLYELKLNSDYWEICRRLEQDSVTAVLLAHEGFDLQLLKTLGNMKWKVPGDLSIIAWENPGVSRFVSPALTTFGQDFPKMIQRGVELMSSLLCTSRRQARDVSVPYLFYARESVGAPPDQPRI